MKVFAIGDLHLSGADPKPMDIFGSHWGNHFERIREDWLQRVSQEDLVLIPGDISWAMKLEDAVVDLDSIGALPVQKVLTRGNHDYWWKSPTKIRARLLPGTYVLQNDSIQFGGVTVCGSRGWVSPGGLGYKQEDEKIYQREVLRMGLSLQAAKKPPDGKLVVMIHYPPFNERQEPSGFVELFEQYGVDLVVYGHLHGKSCRSAFEGRLGSVEYRLTSCDHLGFKLLPLFSV